MTRQRVHSDFQIVICIACLILGWKNVFKTKSIKTSAAFIQEKLNHSYEIRPFPRVITNLLAAVKDADTSAEHLAHIVESDAALSARILRMANSPVCGVSNVIKSIEQATVVLGRNRLKSLAQTYAAHAMFASSDPTAKQRQAIWDHSLAVATTARLIASVTKKISPDEAFLSGVFHDVGQLFFLDVIPDEYMELIEEINGNQLVAQEMEHFGVSHQEAGVKLTTSWQMPESVMVAVGFHHQPEKAIAHAELAATICVANGLARANGIGSVASPEISIGDIASAFLNLEESDLVALAEHADAEFAAVRQAFAG